MGVIGVLASHGPDRSDALRRIVTPAAQHHLRGIVTPPPDTTFRDRPYPGSSALR